ncbi:MAG: MFS transporter [Acidimicrobiia bacterium]|nr:MFS transporter [Acidimicrobiia bacterium]
MHQVRLLTPAFISVFAANLLNGLSFFLFVHLPGFLTGLGANETEIGLLFAVSAIAAIGIRPWLGAAIDERGRRPVIAVTGLLNIVATLLYLTVSTLGPWLYVVRIMHGIAIGGTFTALVTIGADVIPAERRTEGLALFGVSGLLPIALGGLLGDFLVADGNFDTLFIAAGVLAVVAYVLAMSLGESASTTGDRTRPSYLAAIRQPSLLPLWWIVGMFSLVLTGYFTFMRTFVDTSGIGSVGIFFAFYATTAILVRVVGSRLPSRFGEKRVLMPALSALVVGFVVLAQTESVVDVALAGVLSGIGHGYAFPILFAFTVTRTPDDVRGASLSFFTALFDVGVLIGGPLLGAIIEGAGYSAMFLTADAMLTFAMVTYYLWDRRWDVQAEADADTVSPIL